MKWIKTLNLEHWAETNAAKTIFPELIADLIRASSDDITNFRFPNGDKGQVRGFDGVLRSSGTPPYVPEGESIWELGTTKDFLSKAGGDFEKRTGQVEQLVQAESTFVFVTPWAWDHPTKKLPDWLEEQKQIGHWKSVQVIDGSMLEDWLEERPAVAAKYARYVLELFPGHGVRSTDEFWDEYSNKFSPQLSEEVLLAGREAQVEKLLQRLLEEKSGMLKYAADSPEEVVAFIVAAIRKADPSVRYFLEAKTLVLDNEADARRLFRRKGLVFIPRDTARAVEGSLSQHCLTVSCAGVDGPRSQHEILRKPTNTQLGEAFQKMGYSQQEAYELSKRCGRSLSVLARLRANGTPPPPEWTKKAAELIPALLAGSWMSAHEPDKNVLANLGGKAKYEEVEAPLRAFLNIGDAPIDRIQDMWAMRASIDAFLHLGSYVGKEHLERFETQAKEIFSEVLPPPEADDKWRPFKQKRHKHSDCLRDGMMTTLLHMAALHEDARFIVDGESPQAFVNSIVRKLPGLHADYRLMESLKDNLALLAEAAPIPFLEALESLLEGDVEKIKPIFNEQEGVFGSRNDHVGVLWALETLAWNRTFLLRASICLAKLAVIDPGGNLGNRPINSLRDILLSWSPNTSAGYKERLGVIAHVVQQVPGIAWPLLVKLLPRAYDSSSQTNAPRFGEYSPGGGEVLTYGIVWECEAAVVDMAITCAALDSDKWSVLITTMHQVQKPSFDKLFKALERCLSEQSEKGRYVTWDTLRKEVNRHKAFEGVEWAFDQETSNRIETLVEQFKPTDPIQLHAWLFDDGAPDIPGKLDDGDIMQRIEAVRLNALSEVYAQQGCLGLATLAYTVKLPEQMTLAARQLDLPAQELQELIVRLMSFERPDMKPLVVSLSERGFAQYGDAWLDRIRRLASQLSLQPMETAQLFLGFDVGPETWSIVTSFGPEVEKNYWLQKQVFTFDGDADDLLHLVTRLEDSGRLISAIQAVQRRLKDIPSTVLLRLLQKAIPEINAAADGNGVGMLVYYVEQLFDELERREDVSQKDLASAEFAYLAFLNHRRKPLTLHRMMVAEAAIFMEIVQIVFKPASGDAPPLTDDSAKLASAGYDLLRGVTILPGQTELDINFDVLDSWCREVRRLANECDRSAIADSRIGSILAHSPNDPRDGSWPHLSIRKLIEASSSKDMEQGISTERFNMRGVYSKSIGEGGKQERDLAAQYRQWATATPEYPRTAALLNSIADSWERYADGEDTRAEQEGLRW